MQMIKYLLPLLLIGCLEQPQTPAVEIKDMTGTTDLRQFNCEIDRIDPTSKKTWGGQNCYWDCKLQTYCTPEIINNELLCVPTPVKLYEDVIYYDNKCEFPINSGLTHVLLNNGEDVEVPLHIKYIGGSYGVWYKADPLYLGPTIDIYSVYNLKCLSSQYTNPILYIEEPSPPLTLSYLYKIDWQWK